jgi:NAD(P)-dependent dehydrogenase (short-subunit alcohol dehydrogenase family)
VNWENNLYVVTGHSRGIGSEVSDFLIEHGASVVGVSRSSQAKRKGLVCMKGDLTDQEFVHEVKLEVMRRSKKTPLRGIVNCAGVIETQPAVRFDRKMAEYMLDVNYLSAMALCTTLIPRMVVAGGGSIVSVSSNADSQAIGGRASYAASKAALSAYTRVLAREMGGRGVRANVVEPGLTQTKLMIDSTPEIEIEMVRERTSLNKVANPNEIASVIAFLLSDASKAITGQVLRADCGY